MKIIWSPTARAHLRHAVGFIAADNPKAAKDIALCILEAVEHLPDFPASGRPGRVPHTRELVITGTPFFLPYRLRDGNVEILGVIHEARKWPPQPRPR